MIHRPTAYMPAPGSTRRQHIRELIQYGEQAVLLEANGQGAKGTNDRMLAERTRPLTVLRPQIWAPIADNPREGVMTSAQKYGK